MSARVNAGAPGQAKDNKLVLFNYLAPSSLSQGQRGKWHIN